MVVLLDTLAAKQAEFRLRRIYKRAPADVKRRGRDWYPTMRARLESLAADTGYTLEQAVSVLSITSPGAQLVSNIAWTETALTTDGQVPVGRFPVVMGRKIRATLSDPEAAAEWARGPKVGAFYRAILGDSDALVIDRWAAAAAGYRSTDGKFSERERRILERAYRAAAKRFRIPVRDLQAIVWIQARETTPRKSKNGKSIVPRLADITA